MASRHERFSLHDVTFAGVSLPSATVDCWDDASGRSQWQARALTRACPEVEEGELAGHTADGRALSGHARVADQQVGPGSRRETLVVFHGAGTLHGR
ncbi:MAG: hypothetical protein A2V85_01715 [Chloroflexi bacterium RBG_16_72_14]|nr:MAG: hypothetical protein A2V85_01715 [Chloroflexi bacterium RBG_16_72_14]